MIRLAVGTLIRMKVNIDLLDGCSVCVGDIGMIISNNVSIAEIVFTDYDYEILINDCQIFVFKSEIEELI